MASPLDAVFEGTEPIARTIYDRLIAAMRDFGPMTIEPKKTSIHIVRKSGFAGVHPRKSAILLNIRTAAPIESARIRKTEKVSANRCHNEVLLTALAEIDKELMGWLRTAYDL